jgi:hypothetical protein
MKTINHFTKLAVIIGSLVTSPTWAAPVVFSGSGTQATNALNDFRAAIGGAKNTAAAPQISGRREISWDGVKLDGTDVGPNTQVVDANKTVIIGVDRFKGQGTLFEDPYAVSGDGFASVNPGSSGQFAAFSPKNTFAMQDSSASGFDDRFIGESFVLAGSNTSAGTRGFGAIFLDVENAGSTSIEYYGRNSSGEKTSLGVFAVPVGTDGEPQFLAVLFDNPIITEVDLTVGSKALFSFDGSGFQSFGAEDLARGIDLVVTDDFVFAEPTLAVAVPAPASLALAIVGLAMLGFNRRQTAILR